MKHCNIRSHIASCLNLDIVASIRQKHVGTIEQLGIRVDYFLEEIWQEEELFHESGKKFTPQIRGVSDAVCKRHCVSAERCRVLYVVST